MNFGIKIAVGLSIAWTCLASTPVLLKSANAQSSVQCECGNAQCQTCSPRPRLLEKLHCQTCGRDGGCTQCPSCDGEFCRLELDHTPIKKTCFTVELKTICIPAVRLPWKKCCPPATSKTRKVCVLKKHTYECPNCSYRWTVVKPEVASTSPPTTEAQLTHIVQSTIASTVPPVTVTPIASNPPPIIQASTQSR